MMENVQNFFQPSEKKMKQQVRKNVREIDREVRNLGRQLKKNEAEERKVLAGIRKEATAGNQDKVRQMARQLVRVRGHSSKLTTMMGSMTDVKLQLQTMSSMQAQQRAMKNVTKMMKKMNSKMSPQKFAKVMRNFQYEKEKAEMNQEMMDDAMGEGDEEMEDEIVDGVLAEIGLQKLEGMGYVPVEDPNATEVSVSAAPAREAVAEGADGGEGDEGEVNDLESRLKDLNKGL